MITLLECQFKKASESKSQIVPSDIKRGSKAIKGTIILCKYLGLKRRKEPCYLAGATKLEERTQSNFI